MRYAALAIAVIALVQPWVIALYRRYFRQGQVDIHETGLVEVGFGPLGPSIGLHGTLRAVHRDIFVRDISLTVVRIRDQAQHNFDWAAFRGGNIGDEIFTLPASFLISTAQPYRFNIVFTDTETSQEMQDDLGPVREAWQKLWASTLIDEDEADEVDELPEIDEDEADELPQIYDETFSENPVNVQAYQNIGRRFYWDAGTYGLELTVNSSRPDARFPRRWKFEVTDQDAQLLQRNVVSVLRNACDISDLPFNTTYSKYLDFDTAGGGTP